MADWLQKLFVERGLPSHGYCLLWDPTLIWTHVISDTLIALAYFSIPIVLATFLAKRRDVQFGWVLKLFAVFILACGTTHVLSILVLWVPAYGIEGVVKAITALASVVTAVLIWPLLPRLLAIPSPGELQRVNDQLRSEAAERERAEAMLRQSQKMEAVGQLTGGIAHDFNNLLTIMLGNLDRALRRMPDGSPGAQNIQDALSAAEKAAILTDQLLTFARKQPLQVGSCDLHAIIRNLTQLLERSLGADINLVLELDPSVPAVRVDQSQLENALINLAVNAKDAMPDGGNLTISTRTGPDRIVSIRVTDTGTGMDAETAKKAVEPFFTTKSIGKGSGLGLSQVYGFVAQAGGQLEIFSNLGTGTTVQLFLPPFQEGHDVENSGC